jgi:hypothetical protein
MLQADGRWGTLWIKIASYFSRKNEAIKNYVDMGNDKSDQFGRKIERALF